jgi:hypothetical protein
LHKDQSTTLSPVEDLSNDSPQSLKKASGEFSRVIRTKQNNCELILEVLCLCMENHHQKL